MYIPLYPRNPFGYGRHALPKSAHDLETNSCDPSCAQPNGVRDPAYIHIYMPHENGSALMDLFAKHTMSNTYAVDLV